MVTVRRQMVDADRHWHGPMSIPFHHPTPDDGWSDRLHIDGFAARLHVETFKIEIGLAGCRQDVRRDRTDDMSVATAVALHVLNDGIVQIFLVFSPFRADGGEGFVIFMPDGIDRGYIVPDAGLAFRGKHHAKFRQLVGRLCDQNDDSREKAVTSGLAEIIQATDLQAHGGMDQAFRIGGKGLKMSFAWPIFKIDPSGLRGVHC